MDEIVRPSSWPIRRERRHIATINAHGQIHSKLKDIYEKIETLRSSPSLPPGLLSGQHIDIERLVGDRFSAIEKYLSERFEEIGDKIDSLVHMQVVPIQSVVERMERLETIVVCSPRLSPQVDEVLNGLLTRSENEEPDKEVSPVKERSAADGGLDGNISTCISDHTLKNLMDNAETVASKVADAKCLNFDIFDQLMNGSTQTTSNVQTNGTQTCAYSKPRKGRVNGRATQTESLSKDAFTDTETDVEESMQSMRDYMSLSPQKVSRDVEETIKPCIVNQRFVDVILKNMDQLMEERLARLYEK